MAKCFLTIDPKTGERKYEIEGMGGVSCDQITEKLIQSNEQVEHQRTEEYYKPEELPDYAES